MRKFIHRDKNGKVIPDISKVKIPYDLSVSIVKILNPGIAVAQRKETQAQ